MRFPAPLTRATLRRRYKRFLADMVLEDGTEVTAHVANSGAMLGLSDPGLTAWLSRSDKPGRKLAWSWELAEVEGLLVGINTQHPNAIAAEAVRNGAIPELSGYAALRREVAYGRNSRIDLLLEDPARPKCYVEVKNVHLKQGEAAAFPDAVTARGAKHLAELSDMAAAGHRAVMLFLVQRMDCRFFRPAAGIDPVYARALKSAVAAGVEVLCYDCRLTLDGIDAGKPLPLRLFEDERGPHGSE
ncbi:sugar fermentation stimulation protein A [mine drainage metagenome]|uniref:Sugar fermentation stimulation protein A n=1 Tax=mine drainage metagenome TaxID=410659 RepID=A0A1J5RG97_9ZZZZ